MLAACLQYSLLGLRQFELMHAAYAGPYHMPALRGLQALLSKYGEGGLTLHVRFGIADIYRLASILLPEEVRLPNRHGSVSNVDALTCLLL